MRIIALMNQKGGVGKTTTTVNLGAALAELGQRVCLIDLDPQAHLTINYGREPGREVVDLYDVLVEERPLNEAMLKIDERVTLIPSSIDLAAAEIELVSVLGRELILKRRFEAAMALAGQPGSDLPPFDFDFVLLDCPPSLGLLTLNALGIATEVLVPMQPHFLALQGMAKLLETVQLVNKRMNPKLRVSGIVLTMYDAQTKLSNEVVAELNGFIASAQDKSLPWSGAKVFNSRIRRNIKLAESPSFGQTILVYEPTSNGAADYRALGRELLGLPEASDSAKEASALGGAKPSATPRPRAAKAKPASAPPASPVTVTVEAVDPSTLAAANVTAPVEPAPAAEVPLQMKAFFGILVLLTLGCWGYMLLMTHSPQDNAWRLRVAGLSDTFNHLLAFGMLGGLLSLCIWAMFPRRPLLLGLALPILLAYAAVDELTRPLVTLRSQIRHWAADGAGAAIAVVCIYVFGGLSALLRRPARRGTSRLGQESDHADPNQHELGHEVESALASYNDAHAEVGDPMPRVEKAPAPSGAIPERVKARRAR